MFNSSNQKEWTTLSEYLERMPKDQKESIILAEKIKIV